MLTNTVIDLNNRTLAFLREQDFEHAIESSTCAMINVKPLVDTVLSSHNPITECIDHCILRSPVTHPGDPQSSNREVFLYKHGIPLPRDTTDLKMMTQILVFNAALAHQLFAEHYSQSCGKQQAESSMSLQKAKMLYQLVNSQGSVDVNVNVLFHFVIMNNIAVIDRTLGKIALSNASFCYLQARYLIMMHHGDSARLRHLQGFWANIRGQHDAGKRSIPSLKL